MKVYGLPPNQLVIMWTYYYVSLSVFVRILSEKDQRQCLQVPNQQIGSTFRISNIFIAGQDMMRLAWCHTTRVRTFGDEGYSYHRWREPHNKYRLWRRTSWRRHTPLYRYTWLRSSPLQSKSVKEKIKDWKTKSSFKGDISQHLSHRKLCMVLSWQSVKVDCHIVISKSSKYMPDLNIQTASEEENHFYLLCFLW